jgi:colicin import membrane protein
MDEDQAMGPREKAEAGRALLDTFIKDMASLGVEVGGKLAHVEAMLPTPPKQEQVEAQLWKKLGAARAHSIEMEKQASKAEKEVARLQLLLHEAQEELDRATGEVDKSYVEITKAEQEYKAHKEVAKKSHGKLEDMAPGGPHLSSSVRSEEVDEDMALEEEERELERQLQEKRQKRQELLEQRKKRKCNDGSALNQEDDLMEDATSAEQQAAQKAKLAAEKAEEAKAAAIQAKSGQTARSRSRGQHGKTQSDG